MEQVIPVLSAMAAPADGFGFVRGPAEADYGFEQWLFAAIQVFQFLRHKPWFGGFQRPALSAITNCADISGKVLDEAGESEIERETGAPPWPSGS